MDRAADANNTKTSSSVSASFDAQCEIIDLESPTTKRSTEESEDDDDDCQLSNEDNIKYRLVMMNDKPNEPCYHEGPASEGTVHIGKLLLEHNDRNRKMIRVRFRCGQERYWLVSMFELYHIDQLYVAIKYDHQGTLPDVLEIDQNYGTWFDILRLVLLGKTHMFMGQFTQSDIDEAVKMFHLMGVRTELLRINFSYMSYPEDDDMVCGSSIIGFNTSMHIVSYEFASKLNETFRAFSIEDLEMLLEAESGDEFCFTMVFDMLLAYLCETLKQTTIIMRLALEDYFKIHKKSFLSTVRQVIRFVILDQVIIDDKTELTPTQEKVKKDFELEDEELNSSEIE